MRYVIVRTDGAYVTRPGSASSYTRDLRQARVLVDPSPETITREVCGNERLVPLESQLPGVG